MRAAVSDRGAMLARGLGVSQCAALGFDGGKASPRMLPRAISSNGVNTKVVGSLGAANAIGTNDWALECWFTERTQKQWAGLISTSRTGATYPDYDVPLMTMRNMTTQFGINRVGVSEGGAYVELGADHYNVPIFGVVTRVGATVYVYAWKRGALLQASCPATGGGANLSLTNNSADLLVGLHWESGGCVNFDGLINAVRVYAGRGLALGEAAEHARGVFNNNSGLVGRWDFDDPDGPIAYDKSGYGNHGTLVNAPQRVRVFKPDRVTT